MLKSDTFVPGCVLESPLALSNVNSNETNSVLKNYKIFIADKAGLFCS